MEKHSGYITDDDRQKLQLLADECIELSKSSRPEVLWLKEKYSEFKKKENEKSSHEADKKIYMLMYNEAPRKDSEVLKIRYWRTGRHVPSSRSQCIDFGHALGLTEEEIMFLLKEFANRSEATYGPKTPANDQNYKSSQGMIQKILEDYIVGKLEHLPRKVMRTQLRHMFFTDAYSYVSVDAPWPQNVVNHMDSIHYESEFTKFIKLYGDIPRSTMIRNLIILGMPDLSLATLNSQLAAFGYCNLHDDHTLSGGERLDWLLIRLFEMWEERCKDCRDAGASTGANGGGTGSAGDGGVASAGDGGDFRLLWFQEACRLLDGYFIEAGMPHLQFMYFKALG